MQTRTTETTQRYLELERACRPALSSALLCFRTGWPVQWQLVELALRDLRTKALHFAQCAAAEVAELNFELAGLEPGAGMRYAIPRKPRWSAKDAPPQPEAVTDEQIERFLEGCVALVDVLIACADALEGACYPDMPVAMQTVLRETGFDPHSHYSPGRFLARYVSGRK